MSRVLTTYRDHIASGASASPLFEDDFATADFSKHNDHFRWGRDSIPGTGETLGLAFDAIPGPDGPNVQAIRFQYGKWQEVRFHLTESVEEVRTEDSVSNVAHGEVWLRYWMRVPSNYYHRNVDGEAGHNNKGLALVWKDAYIGGPTHVRQEWWPMADGTTRPTVMPFRGSGHRIPVWRTPEHNAGGNATYAFLTSEYGTWVDYALRVKMRATADDDTHMVQIYKNGDLVIEWSGDAFTHEDDLWAMDDDPNNSGVDRGYILGYHNSGYAETTTFYITDFKYGHTGASVGITEQSPP